MLLYLRIYGFNRNQTMIAILLCLGHLKNYSLSTRKEGCLEDGSFMDNDEADR
jgi:hypothetical protein